MNAIFAVASEHGLLVIEDAAQAHGARLGRRRAGSLANAAAFSFYPAKNLGAAGDGGAVVTSDPELAERVRMLANYGQRTKYRHEIMGGNHRLDTLQAAMLRVKLRRLDGWNCLRRAHAEAYEELLADLDLVLPRHVPASSTCGISTSFRSPIASAYSGELQERGIATGVHYPTPIHLQPAYAHLGYERGDFPVAERHASHMLSLPMFPELSAEQIASVAEALAGSTRGLLPLAP